MNWIVWSGAKTEAEVNSNSTSWGNYKSVSAYTGTPKDTGSNEAWKANNIYDLAGNYRELTQEANNTTYRCFRGRAL